MAEIPFRIGLYEAKTIVPIDIFPVGTHQIFMGMPAGNSLLSTLFVQDLDPGATVKVNYWDSGPGSGDTPGERINLEGHSLVSTAPVSERRVISRISNKPRIEIIVTGGSATLGVHISVVADFPQEPAPTGTTDVIREVATTLWMPYPVTGVVDRFEIECDRDTQNSKRLWVSRDMVKYTVLGPGDSIEQSLSPPGKIYVRAASSTIIFSAWLNIV